MFLRLLLICLLIPGSLAAQAASTDPGDARKTLRIGGQDRSYVLRLPDTSGRTDKRLPLVLVLHGGGGNADYAERMTGFTGKAMREGFAVAYPEGSGRWSGRLLTWNAGHCCGYAMDRRIDDVAFINALLDKLLADYPIDPKRIYVTGMSNGGMMAHRLGIALSHRIAAIAPVVGAVFGDEPLPEHPVSALMINGIQDRSVPFAGGPSGGRFADAWDGTPTRPAIDQAAFWARSDRCNSSPEKREDGSITRWQYTCPDGHAVELLAIADNGHAWPGGQRGSARGDMPSTAINATDTIWQFFKTHSK